MCARARVCALNASVIVRARLMGGSEFVSVVGLSLCSV